MRVTRFMSRAEWDALCSREKIYNNRKHNAKTTSVGFCFTEDEPQVAWKYLGGIVDADVCVTFEFPDGFLTEATAKYADQREGAGFDDMVTKTEWCCTSYDKTIAKVVDYCCPFQGEEYRELKKYVNQFMKQYGQ